MFMVYTLLMRIFICLSILAALASCNSLRKFPDVDLCTAIAGDPSYGYCISYYAASNRDYEITQAQIFRGKYIMISPKHFGEIQNYVEYLKKQAETRCR